MTNQITMNTLKKLVGDHNKSISNYFDSLTETYNWISDNIVNPKRFTLDELKGIVSDCLARESEQPTNPTETATEMLAKLGYGIVKTNSLEHLKSLGFKDWFSEGDVWCKYSDRSRWSRYDIYIIWKLDGKDLKPASNPVVGDEYSLSLMSLGCKEGQVFQICQRYNHSARGSADWALGGNLNNLVDGLGAAFCKEFGYSTLGDIKKYMPSKTIIRHHKYLRYNLELNDKYFYESGMCTNTGFEYTDTERYTIIDTLVIDWKSKKVLDPGKSDDGAIPYIQESLTNGTLKVVKEK